MKIPSPKKGKTRKEEAPPTPEPLALIEEEDIPEEEKIRLEEERSFLNKLVLGVSCASFVAQLVSIAVVRTVLVIIAGVLGLICAPVVVKGQEDLKESDGLRCLQNDLRRDANRLQKENFQLIGNVNDLKTSVERLSECEDQLTGIVNSQEKNVDEFIGLVKENQSILNAMERHLKAQLYQALMSVVFQSDRSEDMRITGGEVDDLIVRLEHLGGVEVDERRLRQIIQENDGDVFAIVEILRNAERRCLPGERSVLTISARKFSRRWLGFKDRVDSQHCVTQTDTSDFEISLVERRAPDSVSK